MPAGRGLVTARPFRSPHHSASSAALAGGGAQFRPGECSLANCGVLFLDELPGVLPREPRSAAPAPRGRLHHGQPGRRKRHLSQPLPARRRHEPLQMRLLRPPYLACTCSPSAVRQYRSRVSGPLLDRIDLCVEMDPVAFDELHGAALPRAAPSCGNRSLLPGPSRPSGTLLPATRMCAATPSSPPGRCGASAG